jgi:hypothetical protein
MSGSNTPASGIDANVNATTTLSPAPSSGLGKPNMS